tara:strand:- start:296 stop:460 length:165 start_codon:yes stop_codon:yes gene_type:complete
MTNLNKQQTAAELAIERLIVRQKNKKQMTIEEQESHLAAIKEERRARRRATKIN